MVKKKPNFLCAAEITAEDNYNMVGDGIINNKSRSSMLEHLEALEHRKQERHKDDITEARRERHKDDRNQSLSEI
ncbi:MAG: DUF4316 domain-containing protein [Defluviitaleaceae bacterium]|nr:DUF4316 domain-containing protein [Defluviitaleaceae bacterium]